MTEIKDIFRRAGSWTILRIPMPWALYWAFKESPYVEDTDPWEPAMVGCIDVVEICNKMSEITELIPFYSKSGNWMGGDGWHVPSRKSWEKITKGIHDMDDFYEDAIVGDPFTARIACWSANVDVTPIVRIIERYMKYRAAIQQLESQLLHWTTQPKAFFEEHEEEA